jgi:regulator of RNase E activity RraA
MQESFNQEIQCGGVAVSPGDYILADGSGVVIVPSAKAEEVIQEAEKIARKEKEMAVEIKKGRSVTDVLESMAYETLNMAEKEHESHG